MAASTSSTTSDGHHLIPMNECISYDYLHKWFTIHLRCKATSQGSFSQRHGYGVTYPIETYPCRVYLLEYELNVRIRVWLNEQEVEVNKCSDYMYELYDPKRMKSCWVCKWINWDKNWLIDTAEALTDETTMDKPEFYRLHGERETSFGDGGYAFLVYPVWIHENLPIKQSCRERLLHVLYTLNHERQDFHSKPSPVEDIIDPDLLPYRPPSTFDRNRWIERRNKSLEKDDYTRRCFKRDLADGAYNDLSEHEQIRDTYQWVPSEFIIDKNGKVDIRTRICHLPVLPEYRQAYGDIAKIFHTMLPMFEQMKLVDLKSNQEQKLQVIVKAQSYNLKAGMKYAGRWHTEGQTENIVAVGVYYLDIDDQLEGGFLKFRPKKTSGGYEEIETDYYVSSIRTGTAVVFSNAIPHRFQQIRNLTHEDGRRRTFLNFFIVDPEQPIEMSSNEIIHAPKDFILQVLQHWNERGLPVIIIDYILKMLNSSAIWDTQDSAKEFRAHVRRAMIDEKHGWGYIFWGNCGITEFVRSLSSWSPKKRDEIQGHLNHTESD